MKGIYFLFWFAISANLRARARSAVYRKLDHPCVANQIAVSLPNSRSLGYAKWG